MGRFSLECFLMHEREQAGDNEDFDLPFNIYPFITVGYYAGGRHDLPFQNECNLGCFFYADCLTIILLITLNLRQQIHAIISPLL